MDQNRFDALTRSLAERPSRRRVLAMLGAVTAGLAGAAGRGVDAAPRCKRVDQACQTSADCCPGALGNGNVWCASTGKKGKTCQACPTTTIACNGGCAATASDPNNCGACNNVCYGGTTCANGACRCPSGQTDCGGTCVDLGTDVGNCGACDTDCAALTPDHAAPLCVDGGCIYACDSGYQLCSGACIPETDCCDCPSGTACSAGQCVCSVASCNTASGGSCHCLSQQYPLVDGTDVCVSGASSPCGSPEAACDSSADCDPGDRCVDLGGTCGKICSQPYICTNV